MVADATAPLKGGRDSLFMEGVCDCRERLAVLADLPDAAHHLHGEQ